MHLVETLSQSLTLANANAKSRVQQMSHREARVYAGT